MTDREHNQDHQEHTCTGETEQNTQLIDLSEIGMTALGAGEKAAVFTGADFAMKHLRAALSGIQSIEKGKQ